MKANCLCKLMNDQGIYLRTINIIRQVFEPTLLLTVFTMWQQDEMIFKNGIKKRNPILYLYINYSHFRFLKGTWSQYHNTMLPTQADFMTQPTRKKQESLDSLLKKNSSAWHMAHIQIHQFPQLMQQLLLLICSYYYYCVQQ